MMKTANNNHNKAAFFSLYVGNENIVGGVFTDENHKLDLILDWFNTICKIGKWEKCFLELKSPKNLIDIPESFYKIDRLREDGYATKWRDLEIEDLINYGWVKIKN